MLKSIRQSHNTVSEVADSYIAKILIDILVDTPVLFVARDDRQLKQIKNSISFFKEGVEVLEFPAWDCLPYDRVSPHADILTMRCATLSNLLIKSDSVRIILTTANALSQKVMPRHMLNGRVMKIKVSDTIALHKLIGFLSKNGFRRTETVREAGEFAVRGGMIDIFPSGGKKPVRLDFFGDELEVIRIFDPLSQQSLGVQDKFVLYPASEVLLTDDSISNFRQNYRESFGAKSTNDFLYQSITEGLPFQGYEHWLSFYYGKLETLFDYITPNTIVVMGADSSNAFTSRLNDIADYYIARKSVYEENSGDENVVYRPVPAEDMYIKQDYLNKSLNNRTVLNLYNSAMPDGDNVISAGAKRINDFTSDRVKKIQVLGALKERLIDEKRPTLIGCETLGSMDRISSMLSDKGFNVVEVDSYDKISQIKGVGICLLSMEQGFETNNICLYSEQDLFGDKIGAVKKRTKRAENFLTEASSLEVGDLVVHLSSGIGRYEGLQIIKVDNAPHDCLKISYDGGDSLFVPVENIDVLSRYGSGSESVSLDKLGGTGWQIRKAKMKERIGIMAEKLIELASLRALRKGEVFPIPQGLYDEFVARFQYVETDDQNNAISNIVDDFGRGVPMDRLICGDVGFGKTEVALRAAFIAVMSGVQVAIVAPTTLLARQHYKTFTERFSGFPVKIGHLSRLVKAKESSLTKAGIANGDIHIVVGTHGIFAKSTKYNNLGLLVVDEEQHFGVAQKESLKKIKENVHIMSLSATPIPRTLQMALSGVRDLSIIATPPVDRLAIRTFVLPFDGVVIKEALMRERFRGGQVYYVCPRLSDLYEIHRKLKVLVPEMRIAIAHGSVPASELDDIMTDFTDGKYDILLATNIIESGIDVSTANTMIIHRSDMFGLSQLYQLRGRIGRGKIRAYCYLTTTIGKILSPHSRKRLDVMKTLDTLGAGFNIASHDLDIRGAGNLLGDEQSGHIKEVGVELYQKMLEEAIGTRRENGQGDDPIDTDAQPFSPSISIGIAVLIPDNYITDLSQRLSFYRRISSVLTTQESDDISVEMVDRFGSLPMEVENLFKILAIKILCRRTGVERIDVGDKGAVLAFYQGKFVNPVRLIGYMQQSMGTVRLCPDHHVIISRAWKTVDDRILGINKILNDLNSLISNDVA